MEVIVFFMLIFGISEYQNEKERIETARIDHKIYQNMIDECVNKYKQDEYQCVKDARQFMSREFERREAIEYRRDQANAAAMQSLSQTMINSAQPTYNELNPKMKCVTKKDMYGRDETSCY